MKPSDLNHSVFSKTHLAPYLKRAPNFSGQFTRWFLEHIFRLDDADADDACVDAKHDKGIDAIYVDDVSETVTIIQCKTKTKDNSKLGDSDLKEFFGTIQQFSSKAAVDALVSETVNEKLKQAIARTDLAQKIEIGYQVCGLFITNAVANKDAVAILAKLPNIDLLDANAIAEKYVDLNADGGIHGDYFFDVSDTDVVRYDAGGAAARIFLAPALNLLKMDGIADGRLFEQNVRLSLGNTKVNKGLRASIRDTLEHKNFPLYHNGINVLCRSIVSETEGKIRVEDYVVVNGAQSLTSLLAEKPKITDDLKILVKLIETKGDASLSQRITTNSNNQNAIKARDLKSNHSIQQRIKAEISSISSGLIAYEIKQGESNKGKVVLSNESAGLILLAMELNQPWSCHQKYRVMDDLYSAIFGRPGVNGGVVLAYWECFKAIEPACELIDDKHFAYYNLTKYFLAFAVASLIRSNETGRHVMRSIETIFSTGDRQKLLDLMASLSKSVALDLNAEVIDDVAESFDYKNHLKSPSWCKKMAVKLATQYSKDVVRHKAKPIGELFSGLVSA